jgi:hypothetical protein
MTDFSPADHPRVADGTFTEKQQTSPTVVLDDIDELLAADLSAHIDLDGYAFVTSNTVLTTDDVYAGADSVTVQKNRAGEYVASAEWTNIDMTDFARAANDWSLEDLTSEDNNEAAAIAWLTEHEDAIKTFLQLKGVDTMDGAEWDNDRYSVTVPLTAEQIADDGVSFNAAYVALDGSPEAAYVRDGIDNPTVGFGADMKAYVIRSETDDNCDTCGESTLDNEGYDGKCGACADIADND